MGLGGEDARRWQAPAQLPLPVLQEPALETLLAQADQARLDLAAARLQVDILADGQRLARGWRWLGGIELEYEWEREPDGGRMRGPGLSLELPIFQQGQARVLRADARLERGRAELAERELAVELGVREAHARVEALREIVSTYAAGIVPDRAEAVERQLERYNFMLIGAFELLEAKQAEYRAYDGWIHAVRDYWLARTDLAHAAGVRLPGATPNDGQTPDLRPIIAPGEGADGHEHHRGHDGHGDGHGHGHHHGHDGVSRSGNAGTGNREWMDPGAVKSPAHHALSFPVPALHSHIPASPCMNPIRHYGAPESGNAGTGNREWMAHRAMTPPAHHALPFPSPALHSHIPAPDSPIPAPHRIGAPA